MKIALFLTISIATYLAFSEDGKTLLDENGKMDLALSMQKMSIGVLQFTMNQTKKIRKNGESVPYTYNMLKFSLEGKLKKYDVDVQGNVNEITVRYNPNKISDENLFIAKVAAVTIEENHPVSGGAREPRVLELKVTVLSKSGHKLKVVILSKGPNPAGHNDIFRHLPTHGKMNIEVKDNALNVGDIIYISPISMRKEKKMEIYEVQINKR